MKGKGSFKKNEAGAVQLLSDMMDERTALLRKHLMHPIEDEKKSVEDKFDLKVGTKLEGFEIDTAAFAGDSEWVLRILEEHYQNDGPFRGFVDHIRQNVDLLVSSHSLAGAAASAGEAK